MNFIVVQIDKLNVKAHVNDLWFLRKCMANAVIVGCKYIIFQKLKIPTKKKDSSSFKRTYKNFVASLPFYFLCFFFESISGNLPRSFELLILVGGMAIIHVSCSRDIFLKKKKTHTHSQRVGAFAHNVRHKRALSYICNLMQFYFFTIFIVYYWIFVLMLLSQSKSRVEEEDNDDEMKWEEKKNQRL